MAKGYWIAHVTVTNDDAYAEYRRLNAVAFQKYGATFLVRGGAAEPGDGLLRPRHVVIEFESFAVAKACHESPEYQAALAVRRRAGQTDLVIVEGWGG